MKTKNDNRKFPRMWHETLYVFVVRYKADLTNEQKQGIIELTKMHPHPTHSAEIKRELFTQPARDDDVKMEASSSSSTPTPTSSTTSDRIILIPGNKQK